MKHPNDLFDYVRDDIEGDKILSGNDDKVDDYCSVLPCWMKPYFWDVDISELDITKNRNYIITQLLSLGDQYTLKWVFDTYKRDVILDVVKHSRGLLLKTAIFWKSYFNLMLTVFGAIAELERDYLLQRQAEGIAIAKQNGKYKGRKKIVVDKEKFEAIYKAWKSGEMTAVKAMTRLNLSKKTFYRRVKEFEDARG